MKSEDNKQPTCLTYRVDFCVPKLSLPKVPIPTVICDNITELDLAVGFALNLHRSSNVAHIIRVMCGDNVEIIFRRD